MPLDRSSIKARAREVIATSNPRVITVGLVYLLTSLVLSTLGSRVMSVNISESEAANYMRYALDGNYDYALRYARSMQPPATAYLINLMLMLLTGIVGAGFILFLLNTLRNRKPAFGNLLDGFGIWYKIILLNVFEGLVVGLGAMLLVVPGLIAHYGYAQAIYILLDDPGKSPLQCMRESRKLMAGHKMELFKLDLSMLGWYLLGALPYFGYAARIWTVPYIGMIKALYYEQLLGSNVWSYTPDYPV